MKAPAIILLFSFAIFLGETVSLPLQMNNGCKKVSCMKMKCPGQKGHDQKPAGKCNSNADCSICPVCSAFTFQTQYEWLSKYVFFTKDYPLISAGNIAAYIPPVWKPPNS